MLRDVQVYCQQSLVDKLEWDLGWSLKPLAPSQLKNHKMAETPKPGMTTYQKVLAAWNQVREQLA